MYWKETEIDWVERIGPSWPNWTEVDLIRPNKNLINFLGEQIIFKKNLEKKNYTLYYNTK